MTHKALSIFNQLRPVSVGFDNVFDHFEQMFEGDMLSSMPSFPHYNIVKTDKNKYDIEIALAGYSKKDIEVNLEEGVLSIKSKKEDKEDNGSQKMEKRLRYDHFRNAYCSNTRPRSYNRYRATCEAVGS